ncbi:uncharacterized protein BDZ83DRAFT_341749 [Colletotrichum acutatum]|uniref:Uncharacterized protein n=1 Tax=Glomerella acutata TaxID=27357 RepID=A0AAD9D2K7_GLOAC|nr:uncharacterized protein BDZ83DRAFT_341749 [Colletotrichum acutatum]KAK1730825.1 hypothetical protein BDZ83DRAFT_341749 [Colletotrichum acutatum]
MTCLSGTLAFLVLFSCQTVWIDIGSEKDGALIMICPGQDFKRPRSSALRIGTGGFAAAVRERCLPLRAGKVILATRLRHLAHENVQITLRSSDYRIMSVGRVGRLRPPKTADLAPVSGFPDRLPGPLKATWLKRRSRSTVTSVFLVTIALWAYTAVGPRDNGKQQVGYSGFKP